MHAEFIATLNSLPSQSRPLAVSETDLRAYVDALLRYLAARLRFKLWQTTCSYKDRITPVF